MKKIMLLFVGLFIVVGCSVQSQPSHVLEKSPNWYYDLPIEDLHNVYGVGEGDNQKEATRNGLTNINIGLGVGLKKDYKKETSYTDISSFYNQREREVTSKFGLVLLEFNNYKIEDRFLRGSKTVVLVKLKKMEYSKFIYEKVKAEVVSIKRAELGLKSANYLSRYKLFERINKSAIEVNTYIEIHRHLTGNNNKLSREARYLRVLKEKYAELLETKEINVEYSGQSMLFKSQFELFLLENKFKVTNEKQNLKVVLDLLPKYDKGSDLTTYEYKITTYEFKSIIDVKEFTVREFGKMEDHKLRIQRDFKKELDIVMDSYIVW